ncbi:MAG: outer membrane protein assembly factor BamD [bacterium]|nr:outer membrane protein assembly factor BamD [bacterium]
MVWSTLSGNKSLLLLVALFVAIPLFVGCGGNKSLQIPSPEQRFQEIKKLFDRKKYDRVIEEVEVYLIAFSGTAKVDSAQLLLAEAHFKQGEFILAQSEYERLAEQFPASPLVEEARYKSAISWWELSPKRQLEQSNTIKALEEFQQMLEEYPSSTFAKDCEDHINRCREKLALKELDAAQLYLKMRKYDSAIIYFDRILETYYLTTAEPWALVGKGDALAKLTEKAAAEAAYKQCLNKFPGTEAAITAGKAIRELEKK